MKFGRSLTGRTAAAACQCANVPYTAFARPEMVHCYCMLPIFREAKEDFAKIAEILKQ